MNNLYDKDWEVDGHVGNDWYIVPILVLGALVALIVLIGADRFIETMGNFIVGIRNN